MKLHIFWSVVNDGSYAIKAVRLLSSLDASLEQVVIVNTGMIQDVEVYLHLSRYLEVYLRS